MLTLFRLFALSIVVWCITIMVYSTIVQFGAMAGIATALIPCLIVRINWEVQRAMNAEQAKQRLEAAARKDPFDSTNLEA